MISILLAVIPAILIRCVIFKKQLSIVFAIIYSIAIWIFVGAVLYYYMEVKNTGLSGFTGVASFFILRAKSQDEKKENEVSNDKS